MFTLNVKWKLDKNINISFRILVNIPKSNAILSVNLLFMLFAILV